MNLDPPSPSRPARRPRPPARGPAWRAPASAVLCALAALAALPSAARATTAAELGATYATQAGTPPSAARGEAFFTSLHGHDWRCATCHGTDPRQPGRHAATGQAIRPFAPAVEPARFTDAAKVEKWFRRNCRDVAGRECTPGEKADVLAWLLGVKP